MSSASFDKCSLQCRRILGGRKLLVYVRTVVTGGRLGRVKIVTLRVGARAKEGKRGGPFSPLFSSFNIRFREQNIGARRKRLHCRL